MGLYGRLILPRLIDLAMRNEAARTERARFVPAASGRVIEIGCGSGLNLPFYDPGVSAVVGVDPSMWLLALARRRAAGGPPVELVVGSAEQLPFARATFDTAVTTWTLCSIPDPARALAEVGRVLRPGGRLVFIEHGRAPESGVRAWQDRLTPLWKPIAGGCHLNRAIDELIRASGFTIVQLETGYSRGPRPFSYLSRGIAEVSPRGPPEPGRGRVTSGTPKGPAA
jgi:ubiquinone/menaquinone biosynthesis C-methylase UbiE